MRKLLSLYNLNLSRNGAREQRHPSRTEGLCAISQADLEPLHPPAETDHAPEQKAECVFS